MTTGQGDNYTTLGFDPKIMQQVIFTGNLGGGNNRVMFSIIEEA